MDSLTPRQRQIVELVARGMTNKQIARELGIREGTIKIHMCRIFDHCSVTSRVQLAVRWLQTKKPAEEMGATAGAGQ